MITNVDIILRGISCDVELKATQAEPDVGINEGWDAVSIKDADGKDLDIELTTEEYEMVTSKAGFPSDYYSDEDFFI
ncbi:MAG: hypothetical protein CMB80_31110 [Flammeovirgaceae bacterium]|nr:hypothetical protein [Flammeovirgaceae bacterium]